MVFSGLNDQRWAPIQKLIQTDVEGEGFELAELQFNRAKGRYLLRIFIDHKKGVNIDDCERISQKISTSLDEVDIIPGPYVLEVSSPGLDRPLKKKEDFERFQGHWIRLTFGNIHQKTQSLEGKILSCDGNILSLENRKGESHDIPYSSILKARLIVDF